jgi:hypothetical protein
MHVDKGNMDGMSRWMGNVPSMLPFRGKNLSPPALAQAANRDCITRKIKKYI